MTKGVFILQGGTEGDLVKRGGLSGIGRHRQRWADLHTQGKKTEGDHLNDGISDPREAPRATS